MTSITLNARTTSITPVTRNTTITINNRATSIGVRRPVIQVRSAIAGPRGVPGIRGPKGADGVSSSGEATGIAFAYGDATPKLLLTVPAGKRVVQTRLDIYTGFDGSGASLSVGSSGDHQELMGTQDNDATLDATFEVVPNVLYSVDTQVYLWITPGSGASAGSGQVFLSIQ